MNHFFKFFGRACVLGVLVVGPWTGGGAEPAIFQGLTFAAPASAFCAAVALWTTSKRERQKNVYGGTIATAIALALGLALCCWQLVPLSDAALARVSPRVLELRDWLLPPDAPDATLADVSKPDFQARNVVSAERLEKTKEFLGATFPFEEGSDFDLQNALATDAALENEFLPKDSASRDAWGKTISVYPLATREKIALFWAAALVFLSSAVLFNTNASRRFLWKVVVFNGAAVALFCVATRTNPAIYRGQAFIDRFGLYDNFASYGMFYNKNAAGGYLVLVLSALVSLFALEFLKTTAALRRDDLESQFEAFDPSQGGVIRRKRGFSWLALLGAGVDLFNRRMICWIVVGGALTAAIFASLSRGASIAAVVALGAAFLALGVRKPSRAYWPVLAAPLVVGIVGIVWVGADEKVDDRMSTLVEENVEGEGTAISTDGRRTNWPATLETARDYFWFGSGLGTYSLATRGSDVLMKKNYLCYHAENQFVDARMEAGVVGLALLIAFYVVLLTIVFRMTSGKRGFETVAVAIGGLSLIFGQAISSTFDFGIYLPSNLFLFAALCGALVGRRNVRYWEILNAELKEPKKAPAATRKAERAGRRERVGATVVTLFLVGAFAGAPWVFAETSDYVERTKLIRAATIEPSDAMFISTESVDSIANDLRKYVERRDDCYEIRVLLAELAQTRFRTQYWETASDKPRILDEKTWKSASLDLCAEIVLNYRRLGFEVAAAAIQDHPAVKSSAPGRATDLLAARRICPLIESLHERLATAVPTVAKTTWEREREEIELCSRRVASASQYAARAFFQCGFMLRAARVEPLWLRFWRRSAEYSPDCVGPILQVLALDSGKANVAETVELVVPDEPKTLALALAKFASQKDSPIFIALKEKSARYYDGVPQEERDAEFYSNRANFRKIVGAFAEADDDFRSAIELAPNEPAYWYRRGVFLAREGACLEREDEAVRLLEAFGETSAALRASGYRYFLRLASNNAAKRRARETVAARARAQKESKAAKTSETQADAPKNNE